MEITRDYLENRSRSNESGTEYLQAHDNRKNQKHLDFPKLLCKGQFRIRHIGYREIVKTDYGDNKGLS